MNLRETSIARASLTGRRNREDASAGFSLPTGGVPVAAPRWHWVTPGTGELSAGSLMEPLAPETLDFPNDPVPPAFFHLFAALERQTRPAGVLGITSAIPGEGKTTLALYLARTIACSTDQRVCLLDLSLGQDEICRRIGVSPAPAGAMGFLEAGQPLAVLECGGLFPLSVAPAGRAPNNPARTARSPRVAELLSSLRAAYDLVIVDLPSVAGDNAVPLAHQMDSLVLVVRAGATPRGLIQGAVETLGHDRISGVVLNRVTSPRRRPKGFLA